MRVSHGDQFRKGATRRQCFPLAELYVQSSVSSRPALNRSRNALAR